MSETLVSSLISGGVAILVCLLTQWASSKRTLAIIEVKMDSLTKTVEKHNGIMEKTYRLEERTADQEKRLDSLERDVRELSR